MNDSKKEQLRQYKERTKVGGVYVIRNTQNHKQFVEAAVDLQSSQNRFAFARQTGSCVDMKLQKDWNKGEAFEFEVLEELTKSEGQTDAQFKEDLKLLKEIWREKLSGEFY